MMTERKWTPGEWGAEYNEDLGAYVASQDVTYDIVCHCHPDNAHLIASAPDLYEALEEALGWIKWHRENPTSINHNSYLFDEKGDAALAKARGEQ